MSGFGEGKLASLVALVSILALTLLLWLVYGHQASGDSGRLAFLPAMNAACNAVTTVFLILGIWHIHHGRREAHETSMKNALLASTVFLIGYLTYHFVHGDSHFQGQGWVRPLYFTMLISHIVLSTVALPLVLMTFALAWKKSFANHRKLARWTFPIWLYVSLTGVLIFFFLRFFNVA
jgi:putative membrane protein